MIHGLSYWEAREEVKVRSKIWERNWSSKKRMTRMKQH